jgi:hypothetical protein
MGNAEKIAERLEERGKRTPRTWATSDLYYEAAALIRRLQAESDTKDALRMQGEAQVASLLVELSRLRAEKAKLVEALTPSGATKAAYHGEFSFSETSQFWDDVTEEWATHTKNTLVPWTTIKEIMVAIRARAAIEEVNRE